MNYLVTGGTSGLGYCLVTKLAASPSNYVYFTYRNSSVLAKEIEANYPNTKGIVCNFNEADGLNTLIQEIPKMNLDVLINNAYSEPVAKHFIKLETAEILRDFEHNVLSTVRLGQACISEFRLNKRGQIITILSSYIVNPPIGMSIYAAGKSYLLSMVKSWANENIKFNIVSTAISPSFMLTRMTEATDERVIEQIAAAHPLGRLTTPEEIVDVVKKLTENRNFSGENLIIDGNQKPI